MSLDDRKDFIKWYLENKNSPFDLRKKLYEYGSNDTQILLEAIISMRKILLDITGGFDVFEKSATIAGIAMNIFKAKFLENNTIAIVPEGLLKSKKYLINIKEDMNEMIGQAPFH